VKITTKLTLVQTAIFFSLTILIAFFTYRYVEHSFLSKEKIFLVRKLIARRIMMHLSKFADILIVEELDNGYRVIWDPFKLGEYSEGIHERDGDYFLLIQLEFNGRRFIVGKDITPTMISLRDLRRFLLLLVGIGGVLSYTLGYLIASYSLSPLRKILNQLEAITPGNLSLRITGPDSRDEVATLVARINEMLDGVEKAYKVQERFISDVSHELRTPLASIMGYVRMLKRWGKSDPRIMEEALDSIETTSREMKELIENLLLLAKSEVEMEKEDVNLKEFLEELLEKWRKRYGREIELVVERNHVLKTSKEYLEIIMNVLIDNAVKYSDDKITVLLDDRGISVKDRGEGIPENKQREIFERFRRISKSSKGHGLGLSIAREIAEKLGYEITVKSSPGQGSEFTVVLK